MTTFLCKQYYCLMLQLTPVGTTIFRAITATDRDLGRNKDIDFHIMSGSGGDVSPFRCDQQDQNAVEPSFMVTSLVQSPLNYGHLISTVPSQLWSPH